MSTPSPHSAAPLAVAAWLCATSVALPLSLEIEAKVAQQSFVLNEAVTVDLAIRNLGGSPFIVDDYGAHEQNTVRINLKGSSEGYLTANEGAAFGQIMVMPNEVETVKANLAEWFPIAKEDRYHVQIIVTRGDEVTASRLLMFDIVKGIEIGSLTRPLPEYDTIARTYTLLYWPRNQVEVLFLRIDETPPGRCVGLAQLGNIVRFFEPRIEFDPAGTLTVTHQSSRDLFVRTVLRSNRDSLEVVDRQRLVNPNASPITQSALARPQGSETGAEDRGTGFERRVRPDAGESEPAKMPRRTLR